MEVQTDWTSVLNSADVLRGKRVRVKLEDVELFVSRTITGKVIAHEATTDSAPHRQADVRRCGRSWQVREAAGYIRVRVAGEDAESEELQPARTFNLAPELQTTSGPPVTKKFLASRLRSAGGNGLSRPSLLDGKIASQRTKHSRPHTAMSSPSQQKDKLRPQTAIGSPNLRNQAAWNGHVQRLKQRPATALSFQSPNFKAASPHGMPKHLLDDSTSKTKTATLADKMKKYQEEINEVQNVLSGRESRLRRLEKDQVAADAMEEAARNRLEQSQKEHDNVTMEMKPFQLRIAQLKKELDGAIKAQSELLMKEVRDERKRLAGLEGRMQAASKKLENHEKQFAKKTKRANECRQQVQKTQEAVVRQRRRAGALQEALKTAHQARTRPMDCSELLDMPAGNSKMPPDLRAAIKEHARRASEEGKETEEIDAAEKAAEEAKQTEEERRRAEKERARARQQQKEEDAERAWKRRPDAWLRQCRRAMEATSPRWRARLWEEGRAWKALSEGAEDLKRAVRAPEAGEGDSSSAKKQPAERKPRAPATERLFDPVNASRWEESEFDRLKEVVKEEWKKEFSERLLYGPGGQEGDPPTAETKRQHWRNCGLPADEAEDQLRSSEISAYAMHPPVDEDVAKFQHLMTGKWDQLEELFHAMDRSGDGRVDVKEFAEGCGMLGLDITPFQIHRLFKQLAQGRGSMLFADFAAALAPPKASRATINSFQLHIPFLRGEPEEGVKEVLHRLIPHTAAGGEEIYYRGQPQDFLCIVNHGAVLLYDEKNDVIRRVGPKQHFGEMAVIHPESGGMHLRRDRAIADPSIASTSYWTLSRAALEQVIGFFPGIWRKLRLLSPIILASHNAHSSDLAPSLADSYIDCRAYTSELRENWTRVQPNDKPVQLTEKQRLRKSGAAWTGLELNTCFSELAVGANRPEQVLRATPVVGGGIEATKGFDPESLKQPVWQRVQHIHQRMDARFFRIKHLAHEGTQHLRALR